MMNTADAVPNALGVAEAAKYLGVSHYKVTKFIKSGILKAYKDLSDERHKLIRLSDLDRLKKQLEFPLDDEEKDGNISVAA